MKDETVSLISVFSNIILGLLKIVFGIFANSIALIADGLHSGLDVVFSFVTFLGMRTAKKPEDSKHPYGYLKAESLAGFFITILLGITGLWIVFEAIKRFLGKTPTFFSLQTIIVIIFCIVLQEALARVKFLYGKKFQSLALIADAKHSRADVFSSIGVLIGLFLVKYFSLADAIVALGVGSYILFETFSIGREITDSLLDVANKDVEEKIKTICNLHKIEIADLKTRKIGAYNFAELKIKLPPKLKVEEVGKITKKLEEKLLESIPELKYVVISIEPYDMKRSVVVGFLGRRFCEEEGFEKIGPKKIGERIIIPIREDKVWKFGSKEYLLVDLKSGKIQRKEILKNPYFSQSSPRGIRFVRAVEADKVITYHIGPNAIEKLKNLGVKVQLIDPNKNIEEIINFLTHGK
jgi:cation diffusion facilitator family transporter